MASKQTANKRKQASNNLIRRKRRRTTRLAYTNASESQRGHSPASEMFWAAIKILNDNRTHYLVEWYGIDPATGSPYEPTWEPHDFVTPALEAEWKETMAARSAVAGHTQSQVQSYGEAGDRALSPVESPEPLAPLQSPTARVLQCQSISTTSTQQTHQSQPDSSSLFEGPQESGCELKARDLRSCSVVLASQNNDGLAGNTTTTSKEASSSNQQNSATVNGAGDADEELSATDPAALVLRHSSHAQSPASIEKAGTVRTIQSLLQLELVEKVQDGGCQESKTPESPTQEVLESLEPARQEPQEAHARILEEKELLSSVLFAIVKPSEVGEQQEMHGEPEILGAPPFALANETIYRPSELSAEAESVFQTGTWRKPVLKEAALALPSGERVEGQSQALVSLEQLPRRLSKEHEHHEEVVTQRVPAELGVCDGVDEPTMLLARSERSTSPSPQQSRPTVQHTKECTHTLPVSSTDNTWTEPSATSSLLTSRLDPKNTAEQTLTKQVVIAPARSESVGVCHLLATAATEWAHHTLEQVSPQKTEAGGLPPPPALDQSIKSLGVTPYQEVQHCIRDSMHTIHGDPTALSGHNPFIPKPLSCGETDQNSVRRQSENGCRTINHSISPTIASVDRSPNSPSRRTRSILDEITQSPEELAVVLRPLLGPSATASCSGSSIRQERLQNIELSQQHMQRPTDHPRPNQRWTTESRELLHSDIQRPQHHDPRPMEPFPSNATLVSGLHVPMSSVGEWNSVERAGTIDLTQAAVQVEPKRKRRLTKRTKTGCGTCRRRKKKCDEAKPECSNCKRNGLVCQGYASKVPLPKNGVSTSLTSLQDQTRISIDAHQLHNRPQGYDLAHILNCEPSLGSSQSILQDLHASVQSADACDRAVAVEEHGCQPPASSGEMGKHDPCRILYPREQPSPPAPYPRPPLAPAPVHERDASHERLRVTQLIQNLPALCYDPRVHDQTPRSVSHVTADSSAVASEAHEQRKQSSRYPSLAIPTAALPRPPLSWHKPARSLPKTEKQKMLDGEPFTPYNIQLIDDRRQCATEVYRFNNIVDAVTEVVQSIRERCFRAVVDAAWAQPRYGDRPVGGHLGNNAHVATPFHCDYGYNVSVGDNVVIGPNSQLLDSARITIGENTRIGACVTITTLKAPTDTKALKGSYGTRVAEEVYIGENVYIGDCCVIGAGVRVGNGAIVRSGSVVVHDIPPDYIACGNPANMYKAN